MRRNGANDLKFGVYACAAADTANNYYRTSTSTVAPGTSRIAVVTLTQPATMAAKLDGAVETLVTQASAGTQGTYGGNTASLRIGAQLSSSNAFFSGDMMELITFRGDMTPIRMNDVENYLAAKWGLPITH